MNFEDHIENIKNVIEYRKGLASVNTLEFEEVDVSKLVEDSWQIYKKLGSALNQLGNYIVIETKDQASDVSKEALAKYSVQVNNILGNIDKNIETMDLSLFSWVDLNKSQESQGVKHIAIRSIVHRLLYNYGKILEIVDNLLPTLIDGVTKDKDALFDVNGNHNMYN